MDAKINGIFDDSTFIPEGAVELLWKSYLNHLASVACNLLITRWVTRIAGSLTWGKPDPTTGAKIKGIWYDSTFIGNPVRIFNTRISRLEAQLSASSKRM